MPTPKYTLTPELLKNLTQIERLYGQLESLQIPDSVELNLKRDNMIVSAYASNKIEGNPLELAEVTNLLLDDRVPTNRSEKEVVNYFNILKELDSHKTEPLTTKLLLKLHNDLLGGIDPAAGMIRNIKVIVGRYNKEDGDVSLKVKHDPPFHTRSEITFAMDDLFAWANTDHSVPAVLRAGLFHHKFVYIHPFEDGNGRVCRLFTALMFLKSGYRINRYFILDDYYDIDKHEYSDKLHSADSGDETEWLMYFTEGVRSSLQGAIVRYKNALDLLPVSRRPTTKEAEVISIIRERKEVTSTDIAQNLKISRQQAHNLLKSLVEKAIISKKGSTKSSFYFLK